MTASVRLRVWSWIGTLLLLAAGTLASAAPLSEQDLAKLLELGIDDEAIAAKIERDGLGFTYDAEAAERLKQAGASERVLHAAQQTAAAVRPSKEGTQAAHAQETPIVVWVKRYYGGSENPLHTEFAVNGKTIDIFTSDTNKDISKHIKPGWNTITLTTTPQEPATEENELILSIGPVHRDPKTDRLSMDPVLWQFHNGMDWKYEDGKYRHRLGADKKEATLEYRVYYAGLAHEGGNLQDGDYVLQGKPYYGGSGSPLSATVFVNGTPLNTFVGSSRQVVITPLLKEGKNEVRITSSRVRNALAENDVTVDVTGPVAYNARNQRFEGKPVLQFQAMQGWQREEQSGQLISQADPQAEEITRALPFFLDETPVAARPRTPSKAR